LLGWKFPAKAILFLTYLSLSAQSAQMLPQPAFVFPSAHPAKHKLLFSTPLLYLKKPSNLSDILSTTITNNLHIEQATAINPILEG